MEQARHKDRILPYTYLGLQGRYGMWSSKNSSDKRVFVIVYGQHASLERLEPLVTIFRTYGDVYVVDNPGFGGMDPAYSIGKYPDLHFQAGHVHNFIDNYLPKDKQLTIIGISYGFQIVTQLLEDFPDLQTRTEDVVNMVGCLSYRDLDMPLSYKIPLIYLLAFPGRTWLGSNIFKLVARRRVIIAVYMLTKPIQVKLRGVSRQQAIAYASEQASLWIDNDPRTHGAAAWDFVARNDVSQLKLDVDAIHLSVPGDHIINSQRVKKGMEAVFNKVSSFDIALDNHAPLDLDADDIEAIIPEGLARILKKSDNTV
ncbi:MAG: alpha/beta hydrolase [Candidatus Saccharibacteria bacterium]|nr:alpha/beta hydrolase [Candidatus Saccharibacteria bacterium]